MIDSPDGQRRRRRTRRRFRCSAGFATSAFIAVACASLLLGAAPDESAGLRDPAWAPDGRRIAASWFDRIWTFDPTGRNPRRLTTSDTPATAEREPAWSKDGSRIAFAADTPDGFDLYVVASKGGAPTRVTSMAGDERWPSWTADGRIVFAHRDPQPSTGRRADSGLSQWDLFIVAPGGEPTRLTDTQASEMQPTVSPDGTRVLFVSDRESDDRDLDLWQLDLAHPDRARRVMKTRGLDAFPSWAPDGGRAAFLAVREGVASVWVATIDPLPASDRPNARVSRRRPEATPVLVSRHGGVPAWSPDGRTILIGQLPPPEPDYNGNPARASAEPPPAFGLGRAFRLYTVPAPEPVDAGGRDLALDDSPDRDRFARAFDTAWATLKTLYYSSGPSAGEWDALRAKYRDEAARAGDERAFETIVDRMILEQPLIKPAVSSTGAVVVSGSDLASEAGRLAIQKGGNVVDAMIATSFALGVVEPDASGVGGDGQAILFLKGMRQPTVVEYKDQTPIHATLDNPKIFKDGHLVGDGPAAMNIPGVVAGLDYLYTHYASGKVPWDELIAPAIRYADEGYVLDDALPTTIAEGRELLEKYPEARRVFLPGGRVPKPGDRFVNKDYADTLRAIAKGGADAFYRGPIAQKIAEDLQANGGIIGPDDLAQYRAIERTPLEGRFRGYHVFGPAPPVGDGERMIEALQILDNYKTQPGARFTTDANYFHYLIESWKARDIVRVADPAHWSIEIGEHVSPEHAATLFKKIDPMKVLPLPDDEFEAQQGATATRIGRGTTAFAVADADGNVIVVTQTLSTWGGSFYVSKGLGFLYNNHLRSSRTQRGFGELLPLSRSSSTNSPTLVLAEQDGRLVPRLGVGAAGNAWITASIYSIIANVIDGGMPMQRAIEAPRFLIGRDPANPAGTGARVEIEDRIPRPVLDDLISRGHVFQKIGRKGEVRYGYASAVLVDAANRTVEAGTEPRRSHAAIAAR